MTTKQQRGHNVAVERTCVRQKVDRQHY